MTFYSETTQKRLVLWGRRLLILALAVLATLELYLRLHGGGPVAVTFYVIDLVLWASVFITGILNVIIHRKRTTPVTELVDAERKSLRFLALGIFCMFLSTPWVLLLEAFDVSSEAHPLAFRIPIACFALIGLVLLTYRILALAKVYYRVWRQGP